MLDKPQFIQTEAQATAVIHLTVPRAEIRHVMGPAVTEILATLRAQGAKPVGPMFSYHWKRPTDVFDFEVGFPVDKPIVPTGRVTNSVLPASRVVRTTYRGGYEGLGGAWGQFLGWIEAEGLDAQESLWESYLSGPEYGPDPADWRTELNRPLKS